MMSPGLTPPTERDPSALLRARGLRVTPQRRAILGAFAGVSTEHLSADEVHARASAVVPEISRGTVYAALAELTELGLLAAVGSPEPVRYETNVTDHQHFRCRICLRLYDIELPAVRTDRVTALGFQVEHSTVAVEGICADCVQYDTGLTAGTRQSVAEAAGPIDLPAGSGCSVLSSPIGPVILAATPMGLVRAVYEDHVDAAALRELADRRRGGQAAYRHLADATAFINAYFAGEPSSRPCTVDWDGLTNVSTPTLQAIQTISGGRDRSYEALHSDANAHDRGLAIGTNPLALIVPCHRVTRGREVPDAYIGGPERKRWLRQHELR
jgi:Fe2+ or Zn2+ uptake regulation protein/O6-methylguanine-DNA--protein-cysteine methyltransferase